MAFDVDSLVTERLREAVGVWSSWGTPSYPVERGEIRRWAIAVYWPATPPRLYWDEDYARNTRWGGIIAPPEFNPFAWPVPRPPAGVEPYHPLPGEPGQTLLNGGQESLFQTPIRPGDTVRKRKRVKDFSERVGRHGVTLYVHLEREMVNQAKELISLTTDTIIRH